MNNMTATEIFEPDYDDYVIADAGPLGALTSVYISGKQLGVFDDMDAAMNAIRSDMERSQYWPNVWYVNDHGNATLLALTADSYDEIAAWV